MLLVRSGNPYFVVTALAGVGALLFPLGGDAGGRVAPRRLRRRSGAPQRRRTGPARATRRRRCGSPRRSWPRRCGCCSRRPSPWRPSGCCSSCRAPDPGRGVGVKRRPEAVRQAAEEFVRARGEDPSQVAVRGDREQRHPRRRGAALSARARRRRRGGQRFAAEVPAVAGARRAGRGARGVGVRGGRRVGQGGAFRPHAARGGARSQVRGRAGAAPRRSGADVGRPRPRRRSSSRRPRPRSGRPAPTTPSRGRTPRAASPAPST